MITSALTITSTPRPKRIAFLVDLADTSPSDIDNIVRYCGQLWGGRFHPIIPTDGADITSDWWSMLQASDPDFIFSLVALSDSLVTRINRAILPVSISESTRQERARLGGGSRIPLQDIGSLSTHDIPRYLRLKRGSLFDPTFYYLREVGGDPVLRQFVLRNFGLLHGDLVTAQMYQDLEHRVVDLEGKTLGSFLDENFLPRALGNPIFPIDLASCFATLPYGLHYNHQRRAAGFHLVVGDAPMDAIYHWNLALQDREVGGRTSLWIPEGALEDDALITLIGRWTTRVYWGEQQHRQGIVASYSTGEEKLNRLAKQLEAPARMPFKVRTLNANEHPFAQSFENFRHQTARSFPLFGRGEEPRTEQVWPSGSHALVTAPTPRFIERAEQRGGWMVDLAIAFRPERYFYTNVQPIWRLPKRLGVAQQFTPQGGHRARINHERLPSFVVTPEDQKLKVLIPEDESVIWASCFGARHYPNTEKSHTTRRSKLDSLSTSDKGQYLRGVIGLFGSLYHAAHFFDDPFWRHVAHALSSREEAREFEQRRVDLALTALRRAFDEFGVPADPSDERTEKIAESVASSLTFRDNDGRAMSLSQLKGAFDRLRSKALKANPTDGYWKAYSSFNNTHLGDFTEYLNQSVFIQGLELRCPHCNTTQWRKIGDLRSTVDCEGCVKPFEVPPNPEWSFRINNLIANAIRYHGTLPVLMALHHIEQYELHLGTLCYLPCQDLLIEKTAKNGRNVGELPKLEVFTDLDLCLLANGEFVIGEVKSDVSGFRVHVFEKLKSAALDLLPDKLVLAAFGRAWPDNVSEQIASLKKELTPVGVEVWPLLLRWD